MRGAAVMIAISLAGALTLKWPQHMLFIGLDRDESSVEGS